MRSIVALPVLGLLLHAVAGQWACNFLPPVGGGDPIVKKGGASQGANQESHRPHQLEHRFRGGSALSQFQVVFTADSSDSSSYPIQAFLKFSDGSNSKVADKQLQPPVGTGRMFGPFQQVPGKSIGQVNFRIGANKDLQATGFSYRISVQGCH